MSIAEVFHIYYMLKSGSAVQNTALAFRNYIFLAFTSSLVTMPFQSTHFNFEVTFVFKLQNNNYICETNHAY